MYDCRYRIETIKIEKDFDKEENKDVLRIRNKDNTINFTTKLNKFHGPVPTYFFGAVVKNEIKLISPAKDQTW